MLSQSHIIGAVVTLGAIIAIGVLSGRNVKNASDFSTGGRSAGVPIVFGMITGTLVGGSSTIGTAQLAFHYGLSAWWFTLGAGLACLVMGLVFCKPVRDSGCDTIQGMIAGEFGETSRVVTSVLATAGILINIVAQILSANALLTTMFGLGEIVCSVIAALLMICYVVFGGVLGAGILGIVKLALIYLAVVVGGVMAWDLSGGLPVLYAALPHDQYFNFLARGAGVDLGACLSLVLGVLSTQTYIQAMICGRSDKVSRKAALLSALLIPPIGAGGILIGLHMRVAYPAMDSAQAFPQFIIQEMHPLFGGVVLATMLIAVMGTGSGMALGFGTIVTNDIYKRYINKEADGKRSLLVTRLLIVVVLIASIVFTTGNLKSAILTWGFLSMALRGAVLFVPMCAALFFKGKVDYRFAILSSVLGLVVVIAGSTIVTTAIDPLFYGTGISVVCVLLGAVVKRRSDMQPKEG